MRRSITFTVAGIAQPKGSTRAFVVASKTAPPRAIVTADNPQGKSWEEAIGWEARRHAHGGFSDRVALALTVTFYLPAPQRPKHARHHLTRPDLDKLVRCCKDALTGVLYHDDAQVTDIHAYKRYALGEPHASITVSEVE